ncbi:hypothetical protein [Halomonas caseinilytica]|uniref:hypothetical protein n=1 Tax=Halomonas caseinilytica TaxID=438744 RepID=UPI0007E58C93|nr:hypothetical protein [Halomonas caseinilytica]SEN71079.1 hypothetical protein SAMN04487952_1264 [Halomonas caseinilytica]
MYETRDLPYDVLDCRLRGRWSKLFRRLHQLSREAADAGNADASRRYLLLARQFNPLAFRLQPHDAAVMLDLRLMELSGQLREQDPYDLSQVEHDVARLKEDFSLSDD